MPIFTTIATAVSAALFAGSALATSLIAAGLSLAAKLVFSYLSRPKKKPYAAIEGDVQFGGDLYRSAVFGTSLVKGHMVYYAKYGAGNKFNADVLQLADGRCDGLEPEVYFYGKKHVLIPQSITGNEHARYFVTGFDSKLEIRFYDGRAGQLADSQLVGATTTTGNPWKATSKGTNTCYVVFQYEYAEGLFEQGVPDISFVLRGLRQYDPRFDSTVAGGSGAQRLNTPSTWVWTQNPSIHRLNYLLGLKGILSGRTMLGAGMNVNQIDVPSHMIAATVCDTTRTVGARTIPTYAASLIVSGEDDHIEILSEFEDAMAGYSANMNGLSGIVVGAPQVVAATLTADDIRIDEPLDVSYRRSGQDSVNILSGQFISREANWTPASLTTVTVNADVLSDGRKRPNSNDFLQVTDQDVGQYLLNIRYRQNRKAGKASIPVSRRFGLKCILGDWINWNGKIWLVSARAPDERVRVRLELSETGADIYSESGITPGPIILPPSAPVNPSLVTTLSNFTATAGLIGLPSERQVPTLQFSWTPPNDPTITQVTVFYRLSGTTQEFETSTTTPNLGSLQTSLNILPERNYEARAMFTSVPDRLKNFTAWVNAGVTGSGNLLVDFAELQTDISETLLRNANLFEDFAARIEQVAYSAAVDTGQSHLDRNVIKREVGGALAQIIQETQLRVSADDALASQITTVQTNVNSANSAITTEATTRANADTALANSVTTVQTSVDGVNAQGLFGIQTQTNPNAGSLVTINLLARAAVTGTAAQIAWKTSGFSIDIYMDGAVIKSRTIIIADQVVITDSVGTRPMFVFDTITGRAYIDNAYIRNLTSDNITAGSINGDRITAGTLVVDFADINNVSINSGDIAIGAITNTAFDSKTSITSVVQPNTWTATLSSNVASPGGNLVKIFVNSYFAGVVNSQQGGTIGQRVVVNGSVYAQALATSIGSVVATQIKEVIFVQPTGTGVQTVVVEVFYQGPGAISSFIGSLASECNKR